jgi:hypothetical protein
MDTSESASFLRKMKLGELVPDLRQQVIELASRMNYETTLKASSSLYFLFELYQAEKAKEEKSQDALKKAEDLIIRLETLQHSVMARSARKGKEKEKEHGPQFRKIEVEILINDKTRKLFSSIGITDETVMAKTIEAMGERKTEERIELVHATNLGNELTRRFFPAYPELLIEPNDEQFVNELEILEMKKAVVDCWVLANGRPPPQGADYGNNPGIMLESFHEIARQLGAEIPEAVKKNLEAAEKKVAKYRGKPMHPDDFIKMAQAFGFSIVRKSKHGVLMKNEQTGKIMCVQISHKSQKQLNAPTIKDKLKDSGIDPDLFEEKRRELGL